MLRLIARKFFVKRERTPWAPEEGALQPVELDGVGREERLLVGGGRVGYGLPDHLGALPALEKSALVSVVLVSSRAITCSRPLSSRAPGLLARLFGMKR
jgi:hypothetical protein